MCTHGGWDDDDDIDTDARVWGQPWMTENWTTGPRA